MNDEIAISVEHVSKKFCKSLKRSMLYGMHDIARNMVGRNSHSAHLRKDEFWAVDNVSFDIKRGEALGIIGPNGSGKTTFLKMLNGIFWPDKGKISIKGRVGALIAVGAGFHPMLTGRENIYINAAILGMNRAEIDAKFDEIIDFADIGDFLDMPVKHYSSGMFVRLGFAIAVHCSPDILLIDEILAVGDVGFRAKCYNKIAEFNERSAIVFVSHSMEAIGRIASKCVVFSQGHSIFYGHTEKAIQHYHALFNQEKPDTRLQVGSGDAKIENFDVQSPNNREEHGTFHYGEPIIISFDTTVSAQYKTFGISIAFRNLSGQVVSQCRTDHNSVLVKNQHGHPLHIEVTIPRLFLKPGSYVLAIIIYDSAYKKYLSWQYEAEKICVKGGVYRGVSVQWQGRWIID